MKYESEEGKDKSVYGTKMEDGFSSPETAENISFDIKEAEVNSEESPPEKTENEESAEDRESLAPWRDDFFDKEVVKILRSGGNYAPISRKKVKQDKKKRREDYTGLMKVYGESGEYSKPFKETFFNADHSKTLDALLGNREVGTEADLKDFTRAAHAKMLLMNRK